MKTRNIISRRKFLKCMLGLAALTGAAGIGGGWYVNLPKFGAKPEGQG